MATTSKAIRQRVSDASLWLPEDMVAEILSWLPVESLLRFKCVCKKWRQLIQQDDFVQKHQSRAAMRFYLCIIQPSIWDVGRGRQFSCIDIQKGLMLEHERHDDPTERLRIRNPATRQTLNLPDLRVGNEPPTWVVARMFFSNNECTVISFSESEESVSFGRFRALTVGVDTTWRPLKNSPPDSTHCIYSGRRPPEIYALSIENVFHVLIIEANDKRILSVDVKDESIKTAKIPENLFSRWSEVMPREWNSKLSLFCDDGNQVNIRVLVNYDNNEWAKTQSVNLATFIQDYPIPFITEEKKVWVRGINGKRLKVIWSSEEMISFPWCERNELSIKPTMLQLKGMKSEKVDEAIGTRFWKETDRQTITSQIISLISLRFKVLLRN